MKVALIALLGVVLVAAAGGAGFYFGNSYGLTQAQNIRNEFFQSRLGGQGGQGDPTQAGRAPGQGQGQGQGARPAATGSVKSVQGDTMQVTQRDGSSVTVKMDSKTVIQKTVTGTATDIKPGDNVTVLSSQSGSDITAQTIQLRPAGQ